MKNNTITITTKLYNYLVKIKKEKYNNEKDVTIDNLAEDAILYYYKINLIDLNPENNYIEFNNLNNFKGIYYVYAFLDLSKKVEIDINICKFNYMPIYIGMGQENRINDLNSRDKILKKNIENLKTINMFGARKLFVNLTKQKAYEYESKLISLLGRIDNETGILYNKNNGNVKSLIESNKIITENNIEYNSIIVILNCLNKYKYIKDAANKLNISERTLYRKIKTYNLIKENNIWKINN